MFHFRRDRQRRLRSKEDWKSFTKEAPKRFGDLASKDKRHEFFDSVYGFYTVQGASSGDPRIFEVFYGARPYDQKVEFTDQSGQIVRIPPPSTVLSEAGIG